MGLIGLLIATLILILIFTFSYLSNSPSSLTPEKSEKIQTGAQDAVDSEAEKAKLQQNRLKNLEIP